MAVPRVVTSFWNLQTHRPAGPWARRPGAAPRASVFASDSRVVLVMGLGAALVYRHLRTSLAMETWWEHRARSLRTRPPSLTVNAGRPSRRSERTPGADPTRPTPPGRRPVLLRKVTCWEVPLLSQTELRRRAAICVPAQTHWEVTKGARAGLGPRPGGAGTAEMTPFPGTINAQLSDASDVESLSRSPANPPAARSQTCGLLVEQGHHRQPQAELRAAGTVLGTRSRVRCGQPRALRAACPRVGLGSAGGNRGTLPGKAPASLGAMVLTSSIGELPPLHGRWEDLVNRQPAPTVRASCVYTRREGLREEHCGCQGRTGCQGRGRFVLPAQPAVRTHCPGTPRSLEWRL